MPESETEHVEQSDDNTPEQFPDDHPLVRTLASQKAEIRQLKDLLAENPDARELKHLRSKAKRFDELEEAQKTDAEKAADRIAKAEAEAASVPSKVADALRVHLAELHGFDPEDVELFLTAADPELLMKQVARLAERTDARKPRNHVPTEGTPPEKPPESDEAAFMRSLFGND